MCVPTFEVYSLVLLYLSKHKQMLKSGFPLFSIISLIFVRCDRICFPNTETDDPVNGELNITFKWLIQETTLLQLIWLDIIALTLFKGQWY